MLIGSCPKPAEAYLMRSVFREARAVIGIWWLIVPAACSGSWRSCRRFVASTTSPS